MKIVHTCTFNVKRKWKSLWLFEAEYEERYSQDVEASNALLQYTLHYHHNNNYILADDVTYNILL